MKRLILEKYTYNQYINSKEWEQKKESLKENASCYVCGRKDRLHLHHITYIRIGHELPEDLMWLCRKHHREVHCRVKKFDLKLRRAHERVKNCYDKREIKRINKQEKRHQIRSLSGALTVPIHELVVRFDKRRIVFNNIKQENKRKKELREQRLKLFEIK